MIIRSLSIALGTALTLAGCVSSTEEQVTTRPATAEAQTLADVGINVASAEQQVARVGTSNVVNAGLAAGMGQSFGGAGLAVGALGWLTSPGAGLVGSSHLILDLPEGAEKASYETKYAESLYALTGSHLGASGYRRVRLDKLSNAVIFAKPGCSLNRHGYYDTACSRSFIAEVYKPSTGGAGTAYLVRLNTLGQTIQDYAAIQKSMADRHPELSLYMPPRSESGTMMGPRLYRNGRITPL